MARKQKEKEGCDFVCCGHTHLAEADGDYYNSGIRNLGHLDQLAGVASLRTRNVWVRIPRWPQVDNPDAIEEVYPRQYYYAKEIKIATVEWVKIQQQLHSQIG